MAKRESYSSDELIALEAIKEILTVIGEDPLREGLLNTPKRVLKSWGRLYGGYGQNPQDLFKAEFSSEGYDQLIVLGPIEFWSMCEHHMLPFYGTVSIGYLPGSKGKVVGVSKLARVVEVFARRLQIQERLTSQIAAAIEEGASAEGVGVVVRAQHLCMVARGVEKQQSYMTTSAMKGALLNDSSTRSEFFNLIQKEASK